MLSNKQYDIAKKTITIAVPALITLITGLGSLYHFETGTITGTISLLTAFAGTLLGVSSKKYHEQS